jgi:hypothetical protein
MKKRLLFIITFLMFMRSYSQEETLWKQVNKSTINNISKTVDKDNFPDEYLLYELNIESFNKMMLKSTESKSGIRTPTEITVPNVNGKIERFKVYESSNFTPELQSKFPEIRAFAGVGIDDKNAQIRLSISTSGIQSMVFRTDKKNEFIEAYTDDGKTYAVFKSSRFKEEKPFKCSTKEDKVYNEILKKNNFQVSKSNDGVYKTMRLALSCTAEYSNYFGAVNNTQVGLVLIAFNNSMTRVNGVLEKDLALHLNIIDANNIIYYDPVTDPYSDADQGAAGSWTTELQNNLSNSLGANLTESNNAYDIGHLFGASGGGGNAGCIGCVCRNDTASTTDRNKGSAYTSPANDIPTGDTFDIDYVAHEIGHQLGGNHTFSHSFEDNPVNVEPGSGSSIMAYAGITGPTDVQQNSDDYFAYRSILQIQTNLSTKTCPVTTILTNQTPVISAGSNYTIPKSTPFVLTGTGTDPDGNTISYTWEENDDETNIIQPAGDDPTAEEILARQTASFPSPTKINGPNFRSVKPSSLPVRYLPSLQTLISGKTSNTWEALSSVSRTLNFTLTGRDNVVSGGQTQTASVVITVDDTKGPLDVTSQATLDQSWQQGSTQTITWDVNNTNNITGGATVDILLSTDGGLSYPTVLISNTLNDGNENIVVPNIASQNCRVMVKAKDNIFFDINTKPIAIGYTVVTTTVCKDYTRTFSPPRALTTNYIRYGILSPNTPITDDYTISDVNVKVVSTATSTNQLSFGLTAPNSTAVDVILFDGPTSNCDVSKANLNVVFDDEASGSFDCNNTNSGASYTPIDALSFFDEKNSVGVWGLAAKSTNTANTMSSVTLTLCRLESTFTLSNEDFEFNDFSLSPNPNNGNFNLKLTSTASENIKINIVDMRGHEVYQKSFNNTGTFDQNINLNKIQSGIYLASISDGLKRTVKRIRIK